MNAENTTFPDALAWLRNTTPPKDFLAPFCRGSKLWPGNRKSPPFGMPLGLQDSAWDMGERRPDKVSKFPSRWSGGHSGRG